MFTINDLYKIAVFVIILAVAVGIDSLLGDVNNLVVEQDGEVASKYSKERDAYMRNRLGSELGAAQHHKSLERAKKLHTAQLRENQLKDGGLSEWEDLGPRNVGGRLRTVWPDLGRPDTIFTGAAAGGIWKSTDAGNNWTVQNPEQVAWSIMDIVQSPSNLNVMYAATGEYIGSGQPPGVGILKSTDRGETWTVKSVGNSFFGKYITKIRINPKNENTLYAAGRGALFRSNDAGETWNTIFFGPSESNFTDLEINPNDTSMIFIGADVGLWVSSDTAQLGFIQLTDSTTLIPPSNGWITGRCEVQFCPINSNVIYVMRYLTGVNNGGCSMSSCLQRTEIWQSINKGISWTRLKSTTGTSATRMDNILGDQGQYDNVLWVDPTNCNFILLGGIDLWKYDAFTDDLIRISSWSNDIGGYTYSQNNSIHADQHAIIHDPNFDGVINKRVYVGNDGGLYYTDDIYAATATSGWNALNDGIRATQFYSGDVSPDGSRVIGGTQDNSFIVDDNTGDGLQSWTTCTTGDGGYCVIDPTDPDVMYASTQNGVIYKSTDGGQSFCNIASFSGGTFAGGACGNCPSFFGVHDTAAFIAPMKMALSANPNNELFVAGKRLWKSVDQAQTWSVVKGDQKNGRKIEVLEMVRSSSQVIWLAYNNFEVYNSYNGGASWSRVDTNLIQRNRVNDIAINPSDPDEVIILQPSLTTSNVQYTNDRGLTWQSRSMSSDLIPLSVVWHPIDPEWVYIGTNAGVFASENDGQDWNITPFYGKNEGPIFTLINDLVWQGTGSITEPYKLCAFTHGRGLWRTKHPVFINIYVDKNYVGPEDGSFTKPWNTLREAEDAAGHGSDIFIKSSGVHNEVPGNLLLHRRGEIIRVGTSSVIIQ